jgi:hypothetical protein
MRRKAFDEFAISAYHPRKGRITHTRFVESEARE